MSSVDHPPHYGGDTPYETIKVIEAWGLGFHLGNAVKYISRAGKKGDAGEDIDKAIWYLQRYREREKEKRLEGWRGFRQSSGIATWTDVGLDKLQQLMTEGGQDESQDDNRPTGDGQDNDDQ